MAVGGYLVLSGYKMTINVSSEAEMTAAVNSVNSITGTGDVVVSVT